MFIDIFISMTRLERCEYLKEKGYRYDSESGKIYGINGKEITTNRNGYIYLKGWKKFSKLYGHHYAWFMTYGNVDFELLDHINRNPSDNRICNLRIATHQENSQNNNAKGIVYRKDCNKYQARITTTEKRISLGFFNTEEEARQAYLDAKSIYHI